VTRGDVGAGPPGAWRLAPGAYRLLHYERAWVRPDVLAGIGVAAYLVPQVMAYAEVAGLPPIAGPWAISVALLGYALVGSSRQLSVGPESTTALLTAVVSGLADLLSKPVLVGYMAGIAVLMIVSQLEKVTGLAAGDPARYAALAAALALVVGGLCLVARVVRLGFLASR
jgi:MFS superfamily sulfate permease-like transporter